MSNQLLLTQFQAQLSESISSNQFIKISLGNYQGNEKELKNIYVKRVVIKRAQMLSFNYRYKTRDIFRNFSIAEGLKLISHSISNDFKICTLFTSGKEVIIEHGKKGNVLLRENLVSGNTKPDLSHNKPKKRLIESIGKTYLQELKITDKDGEVYKNAQDKYRQINQYVQILSSLIKELPSGQIKNVVDMGSGKGYLTFALYDYLHQVLKLDTTVIGVEYREDLVNLCNRIAISAEFGQLEFVQGSIEAFKVEKIDLLIALHACDTATDDAIFKGIMAGAQLIVVAPCCHKQIRREMDRQKVKNDLSFLTRHGIFMERQAEMVTDGIRALILEYYGYKIKVFEFISDAHTPKNVMIVGVKATDVYPDSELNELRMSGIFKKIQDAKAYFGIECHHLERLMNLGQ